MNFFSSLASFPCFFYLFLLSGRMAWTFCENLDHKRQTERRYRGGHTNTIVFVSLAFRREYRYALVFREILIEISLILDLLNFPRVLVSLLLEYLTLSYREWFMYRALFMIEFPKIRDLLVHPLPTFSEEEILDNSLQSLNVDVLTSCIEKMDHGLLASKEDKFVSALHRANRWRCLQGFVATHKLKQALKMQHLQLRDNKQPRTELYPHLNLKRSFPSEVIGLIHVLVFSEQSDGELYNKYQQKKPDETI
jgi:hypothetical protein